MIIYLDKTIQSYLKQNGLKDEERNFFLGLGLSHKSGNCYVCGDFKTLDYLVETIDVKLYKGIRNDNTWTESIVKEVDILVVLSYSDKPEIPDFINEKCRLIKMTDAVNYSINEKCALIAENLADCTLYKMIGKRFMLDRKLKGVSLSFRDEAGGGSTICGVLKKCVETDKNFSLCIVDSDVKREATKMYPNEPGIGDTARAALNACKALRKKEKKLPFELYYNKKIHEIENVIPLSVWNLVDISKLPKIDEVMTILTSLFNAELKSALLLYDLKYGDAKLKTEEEVTYWIENGNQIEWPLKNFPGLGERALESAVEVMERECLYKSVELDNYLSEIWSYIGRKVFSWGCSNKEGKP